MESALYVGRVRHRRFTPGTHELSYRVAMAYLDLGELEPGGPAHAVLRHLPRSVMAFERADYLGDPAVDLSDAVCDLVEEGTGDRPGGPVRLLANLRTAGWNFNPISLYYCFAAGAPGHLEAVVAEVTNTPWGERTAYVLRPGSTGAVRGARVRKAMHVSPFLPMDLDYDISVGVPGRRCDVRFDVSRGGERVFDADLWCERRALDRRGLATLLAGHPLMPLKVSAAIYLEAARLAAKGTPRFAHPRHLDHPHEAAGRGSIGAVAKQREIP